MDHQDSEDEAHLGAWCAEGKKSFFPLSIFHLFSWIGRHFVCDVHTFKCIAVWYMSTVWKIMVLRFNFAAVVAEEEVLMDLLDRWWVSEDLQDVVLALEHPDPQWEVSSLEGAEEWVVVPDVPTTIHNQIRVRHRRRMETPRQLSPLLQPQPTQIMYKYRQRVPHKQLQVPTMHPLFQVHNSQVQQQQHQLHNPRRNKVPKRPNNRLNRNLNPTTIKVIVMDTEVVIEDEVLGSGVAVEIVVDITRVHPWVKITTDKIAMGKEITDKGHQWEIPHRIAEEADTTRIWVVHSTIRGNHQIRLQ